MKQKLSLFALAFIAVCAFAAQKVFKAPADGEPEKIVFENGATYTDFQEFTTENVKLVLGKDTQWKKNEAKPFKGDYMAPFAQTVLETNADTGVEEEKSRLIYLVGNKNPKDDLDNKGGGFNGTPGQEGKLPQSGTYYMITPAVNGTVLLGMVLNTDKEFFIIDATDAVETDVVDADGNPTGAKTLNVVNDNAVFQHDAFKVCQEDGTELAYADAAPADGSNALIDGGKGGVKVVTKITGTAEFDVQANHTYYVFCTGSKLTIIGLLFTPSAAAEPEDIEISPASGDISAALEEASAGKLVRNITINLTEGASYTISNTITAPANLTINGNGATVDASALADKMIVQPAVEGIEAWADAIKAKVVISGVNLKGLAKSLIVGSKYYITDFTLDNSVVELAADVIVFDFANPNVGFPSDFTISNSTIYAPTATGKSLFSSQSGTKAGEISAEQKQTFNLKNSTFYNLTYTKNFFTHRSNSQTYLVFNVENNVFVNCGKVDQTIKGLNQGGSSKNPTWNVSGNVINFDGVDKSAVETTGDDDEPIQNSIAGVVKFNDAAAGDFNGQFLYAGETAPEKIGGDPRWTYTFDVAPTDITIAPADGDIYAALAAAEEGVKKVGNITINLTEGASYTISNTITAPANLTINGNGATVDASALADKMIVQPAVEGIEAWADAIKAKVVISGVNLKGLAKSLIVGSKYYITDFTLDNSVVELAADVIVFDFANPNVGFPSDFTISNSTIYAPTATGKSLFSSQSGTKAGEISAEQKQTFNLKNSTFYNLTYTKNFFTHRSNSQTYLVFNVENNVFVNCGKVDQTIKGLNQGGSSKNPTWNVSGNLINFDGVDKSAVESTGDDDEPIQNAIAGVVTFNDAAAGDFNGTVELAAEGELPAIGDPRWTLTVAEPVVVPATLTVNGEAGPTPSLISFEWIDGVQQTGECRIVDGVAVVYVRSEEQANAAGNATWDEQNKKFAAWDSQFFIDFGEENALKDGDTYTLKMKVKADAPATIGTQLHAAPGDYKHWYAAGDVNFTTEWTDFVSTPVEVPVTAAGGWQEGMAGTHTIALNLALGTENTFYFDAIEVIITSTTTGITKVIEVEPAANAPIYNIAGQRVNNATKGIYIQNGKKFIVK